MSDMRFLRRTLQLSIFSLGLLPGLVLGADDVIVVLSSNLKPYQEALAGFRQEYGKEITSFALSEKEPIIQKNTRIVVAIGGKAALYSYPNNVRLIYCLSPGLLVAEGEYKNPPIKIHTSPAFYKVVSKFKDIQPSLKRLGVLYVSDSIKDYFKDRKKIDADLGVMLVTNQMQTPDELPDQLRSLIGKIDGLWIPPDPALISQTALSIIREFSRANRIPFYVPTDGLTDQGALAAVSGSFAEIGKTAAHVASGALAGEEMKGVFFPQKLQTSVNLTVAKELQMALPPDLEKITDRIVP